MLPRLNKNKNVVNVVKKIETTTYIRCEPTNPVGQVLDNPINFGMMGDHQKTKSNGSFGGFPNQNPSPDMSSMSDSNNENYPLNSIKKKPLNYGETPNPDVLK